MEDYKKLPTGYAIETEEKKPFRFNVILILSSFILILLIVNCYIIYNQKTNVCSVDETLINQSFNEGYDKGIYDISSKAISDKEIPVFKTLDGVTTIEFKSLQYILDN